MVTGKIDWKTGDLLTRTGEIIKGWAKRLFIRPMNLVSDLDHRTPRSDLEDIETGAHLKALDDLRPLDRMLFQANDFYVEATDIHIARCDDCGLANGENKKRCARCESWNLTDEVTHRQVITKVVRLRDPEMMQGTDPEDKGAEEYPNLAVEVQEVLERRLNDCPNDAMAAGRYDQLTAQAQATEMEEIDSDNLELEIDNTPVQAAQEDWTAPRDKWDLLYSHHDHFSAPIFPKLRWKGNLSGVASVTKKTQVRASKQTKGPNGKLYVKAVTITVEEAQPFLVTGKVIGRKALFLKLEKAILFGRQIPSGKWLFDMCQGLEPFSRKRIWEIYWIERAKRFGAASIKTKEVRKVTAQRRKLTAGEREAIAYRRANEIERELREQGYLQHSTETKK